MKLRVGRQYVVLLLAIAAAVLVASWPGNPVYWGSENTIEAYLKTQTPLGSPQERVSQWLGARNLRAEIHQATIKPNSEYPLTKIGGSSFIHESIAHYGPIFRADIEAFYVFDANGKLVDLRVRRTVDAF
jgi:hypothetical protein